jgi:hypothetical protein
VSRRVSVGLLVLAGMAALLSLLSDARDAVPARGPTTVAMAPEATAPVRGDTTDESDRASLGARESAGVPTERQAPTRPASEHGVLADASASPGGTRTFSGWLVSPAGQRLADHVVELRPLVDGSPVPDSAVRAPTAADGRFTLGKAPAGVIEIAVRGPANGDVWDRDWRRRREGGPDGPELVVDEGRIIAALAPAGLQDATLVTRSHPAFWVVGSVAGIREPPVGVEHEALDERGSPWLWPGHLSAHLTIAAGERSPQAEPAEPEPLGSGPLIELGLAGYVGSAYGPSFMARGERVLETLLSVEIGWHRTVEVDIGPAAIGSVVDVGTLQTEPTGRIVVQVVDGNSGQVCDGARVLANCRGGAWPDAAARVTWRGDDRTWLVITDRSQGICELRVEAAGDAQPTRAVELAPFLDVRVELPLVVLPP